MSTNVRNWTRETLRRKRDADFDSLIDNQPGPVKDIAEAA
jgi:hypothetical protein